MLNWLLRNATVNVEDEDLRRRGFNLNVVLMFTFVGMVGGFIALLFMINSVLLISPIAGLEVALVIELVTLFCYYLSRRGYIQTAGLIFVGLVTVMSFGVVVDSGIRTAIIVLLALPVMISAITLGTGESILLLLLGVIVLFTVRSLEMGDILNTRIFSLGGTLAVNVLAISVVMVYSALCTWLAGYGLKQDLERSRQKAAQTEIERLDLERQLTVEKTSRARLQQALTENGAFMNRVIDGDLSERLAPPSDDALLHSIASLLNSTVDTLAASVNRADRIEEELNATQSRYILQSWRSYLESHRENEYEVIHPNLQPQAEILKQQVALAMSGDAPDEAEDKPPALAAPIRVGGQVIGMLGLCRTPGAPAWTQEEQSMVEAVAERMGIAAENLRLQEAAQRRASQERLIAEVSARVRETLDIDAVLKTALRELGSALDVADVEVRLGNGPQELPVETSSRS